MSSHRRPSVVRVLGLWLALVSGASVAASAEPGVTLDVADGRLQVKLADRTLATYVWRDPAILRPYFANLRTPGGIQVTRNHPPREGIDATDHAEMHPGLWLAFGDLAGADFWRNKAAVRHVAFVEEPTSDGQTASFAVKNQYVAQEKTICDELCRVRFVLLPSAYLIEWDSQFSGVDDFAFGDQEEMGLGIRVATPLAVKNGGQIVNSDGLKNEPQVWGKQAAWCDYSGTIDGRAVGLTVMTAPGNFRRSWFHARDYGVLVANPFGQNAFTKSEKSQVRVRRGDTLRLRFAVLVHEGAVDPGAAYDPWVRRGAAND